MSIHLPTLLFMGWIIHRFHEFGEIRENRIQCLVGLPVGTL